MCEGVCDGGADSEARERTRAGHEFYFGDIVPGLMIFSEFIFNKS